MKIFDVDAMLQELDSQAPCGPNLEYDPEFIELEQAVLGKPEIQYGNTITPAVSPDWKVVKRLAAGLLERSRDLRLIGPLLRAALALDGVAGMADCLNLMARLLDERWDSVHPQLDPDDGLDPMLRINSLAMLIDTATVLREIKDAALVVLPGLGPLSVRHLEIASGELQAPDGQEQLAMSSIEAAIRDVEPDRLAHAAQAMHLAVNCASHIEALLVRQVGSAQALNLAPLVRILRRGHDFLVSQIGQDDSVPTSAENPGEEAQARADGTSPARVTAISGEIGSREDVLRMLDKICSYYQRSEPSSPVPLLLERAKRLVPKSFLEIMEDLAPDGIAQLTVISGQRREESSY